MEVGHIFFPICLDDGNSNTITKYSYPVGGGERATEWARLTG